MLRSEFKYFVHKKHLKDIRAYLDPYMELDGFARKRKKGEYTVRSIYFDTSDFYCHWSKIEGFKHRYKIRIRGYNTAKQGNMIFLEIKKKYEQPIFKNRAPVRLENLASLFQGERLENVILESEKFPNALEDAKRFFFHVHSKNMRPVNCVIYEREAYESRFSDSENNLRITLDKNLRCTAYPSIQDLYNEDNMIPVLRDFFIMEVKFNRSRPTWVRPMIEGMNLYKEPASKYCMSIDAHPMINPRSGLDTYSFGRFFNKK